MVGFRPHGDRELQVAASGGTLAAALQAEPEAEVCVVVDGIDLDGSGELLTGLGEAAASVVRAPQRLTNRPLIGLQISGALEHDRGGMRVRSLEEPQPFSVRVVHVLTHCSVLESGVRQSAAHIRSINGVVPELIPFTGLRYADRDVSRLAAPPYDVIDENDRERLEGLDPHNAVRLILPRGDGQDPYVRARDELAAWRRDGILVPDPRPCVTVLRMVGADSAGRTRTTVGVIGALRLPDGDERSRILPHERTLPKAKSDRLALLRTTRANLDPIWGLTLAPGLSDLLLPEGAPHTTCVDETGVRHEAWLVSDPDRVAAITGAVGHADLVIADGHHRFETAKAYRAERAGHDDPGAASIMALVVELSVEQLHIEPIHRLLRVPGLPNVRDTLSNAFNVTAAGPNRDEEIDAFVARAGAEHALGLVDAEGLALVRPRPESARATAEAWPGPAGETDAALVETAVPPLLPEAEWEYRPDAHAVADLVRAGTADAALLLQPVGVARTRAVAEAGLRMPQKSTFFAPKPRTGIVFRTLDSE